MIVGRREEDEYEENDVFVVDDVEQNSAEGRIERMADAATTATGIGWTEANPTRDQCSTSTSITKRMTFRHREE